MREQLAEYAVTKHGAARLCARGLVLARVGMCSHWDGNYTRGSDHSCNKS
jgi:hypothetical protein